MIEWSSDYSFGIPVIDEQHQQLFKLSHELEESLAKGTKIDKEYLIARLEVYSLYHFTSEEQLMVKHGYENIEEQKNEHRKFRIKVLALKERYLEEDDDRAAHELLEFLEQWLDHHINQVDRKYVPALTG